MNQWETETVQISLVLSVMLLILFLFTRKRWARSVSFPTTLIVLNCAWLVSAIIYLAAGKLRFLEGLPFGIAYSFIVFASPLLIAAGALEAVVVVYHVISIKTSWPTPALQRHSLAFLSAASCLSVYIMTRNVIRH
jgi:hypothetical protein